MTNFFCLSLIGYDWLKRLSLFFCLLKFSKTIGIKREFYLACHYTPADLCFLQDFKDYHKEIKIINRKIKNIENIIYQE